MFKDEEELKEKVIDWLRDEGFKVGKGIHLGSMELDIVAFAPLKITKKGILGSNRLHVYVIEAKIATTRKLMFELLEQAITRLLLSDYVMIALPSQMEIWVSSKEKKTVRMPFEIKRYATHKYSSKIGIISVDPKEGIKIIRTPQKSGITQGELREKLLKLVRKEVITHSGLR